MADAYTERRRRDINPNFHAVLRHSGRTLPKTRPKTPPTADLGVGLCQNRPKTGPKPCQMAAKRRFESVFWGTIRNFCQSPGVAGGIAPAGTPPAARNGRGGPRVLRSRGGGPRAWGVRRLGAHAVRGGGRMRAAVGRGGNPAWRWPGRCVWYRFTPDAPCARLRRAGARSGAGLNLMRTAAGTWAGGGSGLGS